MPFSLTVTLSPVNKPEGRALCTLPGPATPLATCFCSQLGPVYTEGGFVEGVNKKLGLLGDSVDIFKGIPFAAPTKALENPQPHPGWQGTLKAKSFKKRCLQATITQDSTYGDEDCLYLNIWVPQDRKQVSRDLPVMIWIYGGAFLMGSGHGANFLSNYLYDGEEIATRGNVIVVTFNYRVGPLGFLSTGDANLPGNYGLRDQHMAIAWVKRNIAAFGGDPNNITLFGESAGGASVSLQTLSPYNKGLIRRAISQSGVALSPWVIQKNPLFWAKKVAEKVGCPVDDTARMAKCLKVTDPRALTLAYKMPLAGMEYPMLYYLGFIPVIDGDFIPDDPINLYANAADIDYIAGINNMDGHLFASIDMPAINKNNKEVTEEDFYKLVSGLTMTKGLRGAKTTFDVYTESWAQDPSQENKKKTVVDFETDILFLVPTEIALAQHRANAKSAKTYSYLFSHPSRMPVYPKWMGADHADDIQYVFGKPFATPSGYRPQDRTVSKAMIAYWTNFAKTGDPNMGHSAVPTQWEPYTSENGSYLEITKKMDGSSVKRGLRTNFLRYWTLTYVALPTVTDQEATPVPPTGDSEATPVPPTGDSEATPVPPTGDSEATPVPPTGDSEATPVPPTGDSEATPVPPTGDSEATPVPPTGDSEATPVPPTGDSEATPVPPTGDSEATPVPPTGDSEATPVHPSGDSEAAPVPPTDYSKGAQMPVVISF
ncbi:bile salt-activated lipase isoform X5 [Macaca thibetana thibetana]|uniref:bile salt-activated lipase isoform X4 n=1 Tax=Macaca thibetana thibetana TaxID=257877 RepID=UPI0021BCF406|nr:bile salt-activated lipase isoform X4 [Macaca thibetana thibetana]XP_050615854.1 bile salt-activated lipase isoform X5 [Macaca thibetana thibetana]